MTSVATMKSFRGQIYLDEAGVSGVSLKHNGIGISSSSISAISDET